jgi:flagellin
MTARGGLEETKMGISIRTNFSSLDAQRNLGSSQMDLDSSMRKLSSGYRITRAADDAAGLAISEKLRSKVTGTNQAIRNASDGISLIQTTEGALGEIGNIIQRTRELAVQASNGTLAAADLVAIGKEVGQLRSEIGAIASRTKFNGISLLGGAGNPADVTLQVGSDNADQLTVALSNFSIGTGSGLASFSIRMNSFATMTGATTGSYSGVLGTGAGGLLALSDSALALVNNKRADLGATQNRLERDIAVQQVASANLDQANSRIRDVDVASETAKMTKSNILMQAGVSVLAQANQGPQMALKLLG